MRLYAVALVTWTATVIASSESNVANFSDHQAVDYAELRDLPKQIVQPYVTRGTRARNSERTNVEVHPDDDVAWREAGASTIDSSASVSIYETPLETTGELLSFRQQISNEAAYAVPEDVLLVENAGSFGQRVRQGKKATVGIGITEEYAGIRDSSSSTVSPVKNESKHVVQAPIQEPFALSPKRESDTFRDDSPFNDTRAIESTESASPNSNGTTDDDGTMGSTPGVQTDTVSVLENDVASEQLPRPRARSSRAHNGTRENTAKKSTRTVEKPEKTTSTTSVEISPSLQLTRFSGPIVVADLSGRESQNVADDYADDASSEVLRSIEKADASLRTNVRGSTATVPAISNSITTSSIMLSPLQVGITLKNADEAGVVDNSEEFAATETKDYLQDDARYLAVANKEESKGHEPNESHPAAGEGKPVEDVARRTLGNSVEIQKSIELYHTAPVHEIHYPVEYVHQTSHLGVIETNNIGGSQKSKLPYGQDERSDLRPSYDAYRGNNVEKSVKPASAISPSFRQEYNVLEDGSIGADPTQTTTLVAEYTSPSTSLEMNLEQRPPLRYNGARPVLLLANQYGEDALYEQSNVRHILDGNNNDVPLHSGKVVTGGGTRQQQEAISEFAKPYASNLYREQQQPPLNQQRLTSESRHPFRSPPEARRPEAPQLLLKIIPNSASPETGFLVPIPRPYPIEKIVEKTVHVPHPIEIEKVIERKVPFPVERVIEKQVQVPVPVPVLQPYPVHVQVEKTRPPHVYPIHVERLIERRIPYAVQRLVVQPLPAYSPQTRLTGEKIADKQPASGFTRLSWPYRAETEKPIDHGPTNVALETIKFGKFANQPRAHEPPFTGFGDGASPFEPRQASSQIANASHFYADSGYGRIPSTYLDYNVDGKGYVPAATAHLSNVKLVIVPKKIAAAHRAPLRLAAQVPSLPLSSFKRQIVYNLVEKNRGAPLKDEYVGPVPPRRTVFTAQVKALPATKPSLYSSVTQSPTTTAALRRVRQPEYPGSFRQSKMEYGFKPPMVPSVQYDENTASKVEN